VTSSSVAETTGMRKTLPTDARRAFWFQALTVPGVVMTPVAPKASADRTSVPRFPGSCNAAAMRIRGVPVMMSSMLRTGGTMRAATP
jgi:hypothetical protein